MSDDKVIWVSKGNINDIDVKKYNNMKDFKKYSSDDSKRVFISYYELINSIEDLYSKGHTMPLEIRVKNLELLLSNMIGVIRYCFDDIEDKNDIIKSLLNSINSGKKDSFLRLLIKGEIGRAHV